MKEDVFLKYNLYIRIMKLNIRQVLVQPVVRPFLITHWLRPEYTFDVIVQTFYQEMKEVAF